MEQSSEKADVKLKKTKASLWSRIKNFTIEPRKRVIYEGDVVRLVPITLEAEAVISVKPPHIPPVAPVVKPAPIVKPEPVRPKEVVKELVKAPTVVEEKVEKPVIAKPSVVVETKVEKSVLVLPEAVVPEVVVKKEPALPAERLKKSLEKTRLRFWPRLSNFLSFKRGISQSIIEELEDILIGADIGVKPVQRLIQDVQEAWKIKKITETSQISDFIKDALKRDLQSWQVEVNYAKKSPTVIMVVGVNGVGKTTAIAKLANFFVKNGKRVMVAACDTFRAAATDQLDIWSKRIGADIVKHQAGSDPAAVAYDALEASISRGMDILIVDTAGRLHTHENLMNELTKIKRVISKKIPEAPHEVILVLDATTGQNAISQAKTFKQSVEVTGIFLAKLDGTAKGGIVLGMRSEINIPVKFIGLGEAADDMERFNYNTFVNALFE